MTIPKQSPDSSERGYLQPSDSGLDGQSLEDFVQQWVAGVAGLASNRVSPRWQPEPPVLPDFGQDWAAVGITHKRPTGPWSAVIHHGDGDGSSEMIRHEDLTVLVSFYGPNADEYCQNLRNGLQVWQNLSTLRFVGIALIDADAAIRAPELIRERWLERIDQPIMLRRVVRRSYPVLNLLSASGVVVADPPGDYQAPFTADGK